MASDLPALDEVEYAPAPGLVAPVERPAFTPSTEQELPLSKLGQPAETTRDPKESFEVASAAITVSGGSGDPDWTPDKPLGTSGPIAAYIPPWQKVTADATINPTATGYPQPGSPQASYPQPGYPQSGYAPSTGLAQYPQPGYLAGYPQAGYPQPGTPAWFGPGVGVPAPEPTKPAETVKAVFNAITLPVLISLLLGGVIQLLAPLMLLLAFLLSTRIQHQQSAIRRVFAVVGGFLGLVGFFNLILADADPATVFENLASLAQPLCWITGAVLTAIIYYAISKSQPASPTPKTVISPTRKVSINTATAEQLVTVPGIGPVYAQRIIAWRSTHRGFTSLDQLVEIDGIGPDNLNQMKRYLQL